VELHSQQDVQILVKDVILKKDMKKDIRKNQDNAFHAEEFSKLVIMYIVIRVKITLKAVKIIIESILAESFINL